MIKYGSRASKGASQQTGQRTGHDSKAACSLVERRRGASDSLTRGAARQRPPRRPSLETPPTSPLPPCHTHFHAIPQPHQANPASGVFTVPFLLACQSLCELLHCILGSHATSSEKSSLNPLSKIAIPAMAHPLPCFIFFSIFLQLALFFIFMCLSYFLSPP